MAASFFAPSGADLDSIFHPALNIYNRDDRLGFLTNNPNPSANDNSVFRRYVIRGSTVSTATGMYYLNAELNTLLGGIVTSSAVATYFPQNVSVSSFNPATPAFYTLWLGQAVDGARTAGHAEYPISEGTATYHDSWAIGSFAATNMQVLVTIASDPGSNRFKGPPTYNGSSPVGSWIDLTTLRSWTLVNDGLGQINSYIRVRLRRKDTLAQLLDVTITLNTYHPDPDGGGGGGGGGGGIDPSI